MKCLFPNIYRHKINGTTYESQYPCGKCDSCRRIKQQQVKLRILLESTLYSENSFTTLTFNDIHVPNQLEKSDAQNFIKRYRKQRPGKTNRYYIVGEYGSRTSRPHFHAILFGHSFLDLQTIEQSWRKNAGTTRKPIYQSLGHIHSREFTAARAGYIAKYTTKFLENNRRRDNGLAPEFALCSKGSKRSGTKGIGLQSLNGIVNSIRNAQTGHKKDYALSEYFERYVGSIRVGKGRMSIDPYLRKCIFNYLRDIETTRLESELDEYLYLGMDATDPTIALIKEQRKYDIRRALHRRTHIPKTLQQKAERDIEANMSDTIAKRKIRETQRQIKI